MDLHSKKGSSCGKKQKTWKGPLELCYYANCKGLHQRKKTILDMHMMLHGRMVAKVHSTQSILHCGNVQLNII